MNKKILFLILLTAISVLPVITQAQAVGGGGGAAAIAANIGKLVLTIGMVLVTIGWVIAGILYLTAAGSPEKIATAKKAMIAAIIGTSLIIFANFGYATLEQIFNNIFNTGT